MNNLVLRILFIAIMSLSFCFEPVKAVEIKWLKLRTEIGLEEIINAVFVPGDTSILVTDANFKLVELDASSGIVKRIIPNIRGVIKFSDNKQFVYTYGWEKVKWPTGEVIGKYPVSGFTQGYHDYNSGFNINEKSGLIVGVAHQSDHNPLVWKKGIWVLNLNTFQIIDTLGFINNYYYYMQMTDDGKYFFADAEYIPDWTHPEFNRDIRYIWDSKTLDTITYNSPLGKIGDQLGKIKTSPDGKWLCSVGGSLVTVFDNNTFEKKYEWRVAPDSSGSLSSIDISPDSRYLATAGSESKVADLHIWDLTTGQLAYKYNNGNDGIGIPFMRYSYSGNYIIDYGAGGLCLFNNMLTSVPDDPNPSEPVLYPNPVFDYLKINSEHPNEKIEIYSILGIRLLKIDFKEIIDVSDLKPGIYFIKINEKFIKFLKV